MIPVIKRPDGTYACGPEEDREPEVGELYVQKGMWNALCVVLVNKDRTEFPGMAVTVDHVGWVYGPSAFMKPSFDTYVIRLDEEGVAAFEAWEARKRAVEEGQKLSVNGDGKISQAGPLKVSDILPDYCKVHRPYIPLWRTPLDDDLFRRYGLPLTRSPFRERIEELVNSAKPVDGRMEVGSVKVKVDVDYEAMGRAMKKACEKEVCSCGEICDGPCPIHDRERYLKSMQGEPPKFLESVLSSPVDSGEERAVEEGQKLGVDDDGKISQAEPLKVDDYPGMVEVIEEAARIIRRRHACISVWRASLKDDDVDEMFRRVKEGKVRWPKLSDTMASFIDGVMCERPVDGDLGEQIPEIDLEITSAEINPFKTPTSAKEVFGKIKGHCPKCGRKMEKRELFNKWADMCPECDK